MGKQITPESLDKKANPAIAFLLYILLASLFILPQFSIVESWPKIQVAEILLPILAATILLHQGFFNALKIMKWLFIIIAIYSLIILISIFTNSRMGMIRDYFEIFKLLKYVTIVIFIFLFIEHINFEKTIKYIFCAVLLFNFFHYIDFMGFNSQIQILYGNDIHVLTFGLNSLGEPDTKRILGTSGNPNNNAIIFLFFTIFFFPEKNVHWKKKTLFYLSVLGVLACQSRTGFIAFGVIYLLAIFLLKYDLIKTGLDLIIFTIMYFFLYLMGDIYLSSLAGNILKQGSLQSRIMTWKMLFEMMKFKPFLGWSPYKEFISELIFPEGEYVFVAWKYGIIGSLAHLSWLFYTFVTSWKERISREGLNLLLYTIVIFITSITNVPLCDQTILLIFAILTGLFFNSQKNISLA